MAVEKLEERWHANVTALSFGLFFIVVGIPVWWKTTTVYRADLPYSAIQQSFYQQPSLIVDTEVVVTFSDIDPVTLAKFGEELQDAFNELNSRKDYIKFQYRGKMRKATVEEMHSLSSVKTTAELEAVVLPTSENKYIFFIISEKQIADLKSAYVNKHRQIFIPTPEDTKSLPQLVPRLTDLCNDLYQPYELSKVFQAVHGAPLNDKELLRSLRFDSAYSIVFSLLLPQPNVVIAKWDLSKALQEYIPEFMVDDYVDLKFKSQVLYHEALAVKPVKHKSGEYHYLSHNLLPHIINPVEARLGSFVDSHPVLNFLVYVPTDTQYPLYIHNDRDERVMNNTFLVPRWGGFMIYNVNTSSDSKPIYHQIDMERVIRVFLPQIKSLLGFSSTSVKKLSTSQESILSPVEVDQWLRKKTVENIGTATHALYSLSQLVQNIRNMVINDDISQRVTESVEAVSESYNYLNKESVMSAFIASKKAISAAEKAFFDPSLLELLYFPEDQKFAIYIPLFLPVGIPVILSTVAAVKWFFKKNDNQGGDKSKVE